MDINYSLSPDGEQPTGLTLISAPLQCDRIVFGQGFDSGLYFHKTKTTREGGSN